MALLAYREISPSSHANRLQAKRSHGRQERSHSSTIQRDIWCSLAASPFFQRCWILERLEANLLRNGANVAYLVRTTTRSSRIRHGIQPSKKEKFVEQDGCLLPLLDERLPPFHACDDCALGQFSIPSTALCEVTYAFNQRCRTNTAMIGKDYLSSDMMSSTTTHLLWVYGTTVFFGDTFHDS